MILILNRFLRRLLPLLAIVVIAGACTPGREQTGRPDIVVTTTMLGDLVANIAGDSATVTVLIPNGSDPHAYQPSARDTASLMEADLVVANGLGLEEGLIDVLASAESNGTPVMIVGPLLDPAPLAADGLASSAAADDPHVWMDPLRMADAADLIGGELERLLPGMGWTERAGAYREELEAADREIRSILGALPEGSRKIVTNHEALGYFARSYGLEVIGTVIPGGSTLGDPSSAELAGLVEVMRREEVKAIFAETTEPTTLADSVAAELGSDILVIELYTEALGEPGSGADTLVGMLLTDARRIAEGLTR